MEFLKGYPYGNKEDTTYFCRISLCYQVINKEDQTHQQAIDQKGKERPHHCGVPYPPSGESIPQKKAKIREEEHLSLARFSPAA